MAAYALMAELLDVTGAFPESEKLQSASGKLFLRHTTDPFNSCWGNYTAAERSARQSMETAGMEAVGVFRSYGLDTNDLAGALYVHVDDVLLGRKWCF